MYTIGPINYGPPELMGLPTVVAFFFSILRIVPVGAIVPIKIAWHRLDSPA